jgi:hypothetical protein
MSRSKIHFFRFGLLLICLVLTLPIGSSLARSLSQSEATPEWEEGQPFTPGVTQNIPAMPAVPITPGTFYQTFSGTSFQPTSSSLTYAASGGAIYTTALPPGGFSLSLELELPTGATITELVFFVVDNDATDMNMSLRSYNPETDAFITLESALSSGASTALQIIDVPIDPDILVDNTTTSYRLRVAPGVGSNAHLLRGARIGYTMGVTVLPMIIR